MARSAIRVIGADSMSMFQSRGSVHELDVECALAGQPVSERDIVTCIRRSEALRPCLEMVPTPNVHFTWTRFRPGARARRSLGKQLARTRSSTDEVRGPSLQDRDSDASFVSQDGSPRVGQHLNTLGQKRCNQPVVNVLT